MKRNEEKKKKRIERRKPLWFLFGIALTLSIYQVWMYFALKMHFEKALHFTLANWFVGACTVRVHQTDSIHFLNSRFLFLVLCGRRGGYERTCSLALIYGRSWCLKWKKKRILRRTGNKCLCISSHVASRHLNTFTNGLCVPLILHTDFFFFSHSRQMWWRIRVSSS